MRSDVSDSQVRHLLRAETLQLGSCVMLLYLKPTFLFYIFFFSFPDLLSEIKLTVGEISRDLTQLVHTFR